MSKKVFVFTPDEVSALIALVSALDADKFPHELAKSVIHKAKAFQHDPTYRTWVIK